MNLSTILSALPNLLPLIGQAEAVKTLVDELINSFDDAPEDQDTIRAAIADLDAENEEGHRRYQAKLAEAAKG